jgi:hypothetical protein
MSTSHVTNKYAGDFVLALTALARMERERNDLETRIAKQKKIVAALAELSRTDEDSPALTGLVDGVTDACRTVFRAAEGPLLPIEVRDRVQALGLPPQSNLLASVHTVIRRLVAANEVEEVNPVGGSGPLAYRWKNPLRDFASIARATLLQKK